MSTQPTPVARPTTAPGPLNEYVTRMGLTFSVGDQGTVGRLPVSPALCRSPGLLRVGALSTLADCVAGFEALSALDGAWVGTAELAVSGPYAVATGPDVVARVRLLKRHRQGAVFEVTIRDNDGPESSVLGAATATLTLLSEQPGPKLGTAIARELGATEPFEPLGALDELVRTDPMLGGGLSLTLTDTVRNSWKVLSGGVASLLAELAAQDAGETVLGTPCLVDNLGLYYLAPGRVGPIEARTEVVAVRADDPAAQAHVRVTLSDAGADDRTLVAASATVRPLS